MPGLGQHSGLGLAVPRSQNGSQEDQPDGLHPSDDPAQRRGRAVPDQREVPLHTGLPAADERGPRAADARRGATRVAAAAGTHPRETLPERAHRPMAANPASTGVDPEGEGAAPSHRTLPFAFAKRHGVLIQELARRRRACDLSDRGRRAEHRRGAAFRRHARELRRGRSRDVRRSAASGLRKRRRDDDGRRAQRRHGLARASRSSYPSPRISSTATMKRRSFG